MPSPHAGLKVSRRVQLALKLLYDCSEDQKQARRASPALDREEFFLLLRTICHPLVSSKGSGLRATLGALTEVFEKLAAMNGDNRDLQLPSYF